MPHSKFGWDLPPGVSHRDIEDAYDECDEPPDEMCPCCGSLNTEREASQYQAVASRYCNNCGESYVTER